MRAYSSYFRRKNSKKGLALATAMVICIVLSILVALLVSMATLNITTTQSTVNQRSAYIQAESALSFAESYYITHDSKIPGLGNSGEGLIVFKTDNISDGATFYETKNGTTVLIENDTVEKYKKDCPNTYITVKNTRSGVDSILTMTAVAKYGSDDAYSLTKEYSVQGTTDVKSTPFVGSIKYKTTNETRYVRFHVRATTALGGAPYFYMWYTQISPPEGSSTYNKYATSSIENKLTFNRKYGTVQNGSWGANGPEGACAMSYEGNGWYVTQKTFNLNRNVHYVNGIITKSESARSRGKDQQSWEFFGIPLPNEDELGAQNGVDVYFELNRNQLLDMQNDGNADEFSNKYRSFSARGDTNGHKQLSNFVKFCSEYYTVYTKTETAIMHYRKAGVTDNTAAVPEGFEYEGYGWWRNYTHNFNDMAFGFYYSNGLTISSNEYGKERIVQSFVVEDEDGNLEQFRTEEEANRWLIERGDLAAGNYVEVNVKSATQPVDPNDGPGAKLSYEAMIYTGTEPVPTYETSVMDDTFGDGGSSDSDPDSTDTIAQGDLTVKEMSDPARGAYYIVGNMNNWCEGYSWNDLDLELQPVGDGTYSLAIPATPGEEVQFWVVQKPEYLNFRVQNGWSFTYKRVIEDNPTFTRYTNQGNMYDASNRRVNNYTNWWGNSAGVNNARTYTPTTNEVTITFNPRGDKIDVTDTGTAADSDSDVDITNSSKVYSVIGWMNDWGTKQDSESSVDGTALYSLTRDMQMFSDVDGILTYSDGSLIVESGNKYHFMIAERGADVDENSPVDWTHVYGKDGERASDDPSRKPLEFNDDNAVVITPQPDPATGKPQKYYVTITYGPNAEGKIVPDATLTAFDDIDKYYILGEFNGWESHEPVKSTYELDSALPYEMTQVNATKNDVVFEYKIKSIQESGHYEVMVAGYHSTKTEDGKVLIDYDKTWGAKNLENLTDEGAPITYGSDPFEFDLAQRSKVTLRFTYHKNDPTTSEIEYQCEPEDEDSQAEKVHVGFHNDQLKNQNDSKLDSKFTTPWERVYVTYEINNTSYCFLAKKADGGKNWWADVPVDAELVYFSNKRTNIFKELHSGSEFEYTISIPNADFASSKSTIFFPIASEKDDEDRVLWKKIGDSKDYFEYVNHKQKVSETDAQMAYYGSTQCNFYDAPFVNVLNMIVTGDPKPTTKYAYSSVCYPSYTVDNHNLTFNEANSISYQGEIYYYCDISGWKRDSSFLLVNNPRFENASRFNQNGYVYKNGWKIKPGYMYAFLFEDQMSLEPNSGNYRTSVYTDYDDDRYVGNNRYYLGSSGGSVQYNQTPGTLANNQLYMDNRAGGMFVSDSHYRDGSESPFNYGGYTPSWYTYRIPVSNDVVVKDVSIVTSAGHYENVVRNNTYAFTPVRDSENVNRPIYYYLSYDKDHNFKTQTFTYNINNGVVDGVTDADGVTHVSVYFNNKDGWSSPAIHAVDPMGHEKYQTLADNSSSLDDDYKVFTFEEGEYTFFQFYDGDDNAEGLENATHKSEVLYLTGEEIGANEKGFDKRTTALLCEGSASGFTWYMHPRMAVMRAYLDMDTVAQMTTDTEYFTYNSTQGVYNCYNTVEMSSFADKRAQLRTWYYNGTSGGKWSARGLESYGDGLLEAATELMEAADEAKVYIAENIKNCPEGNTDWAGDDSDNMIFLEGEQIQDSAFEYTPRWTNGLKNIYKKIFKKSYHLTDSDGNAITGQISNGDCVYTNASKQTAEQFRQYAADLRLWLDNPQSQIKPDAVRIIVDDTKKKVGRTVRGGWGKENIHLYVKDPTTGWKLYTSEICETTQKDYYAYVFMLPSTDVYFNQTFIIAQSMPITIDGIDYVDGVKIECGQNIKAGNQYRYNTCLSVDDEECFTANKAKETQIYNNDEIVEGENSPTSALNTWVYSGAPKYRDQGFTLLFSYDTTVTYSGGSYKIYAGRYEINPLNYEGYYLDFGGTSKETVEFCGIDLYTERAKKYFTEPNADGYMNYGMKAAKKYSDWGSSRVNTGKDLDVMTKKITKNGDMVLSESKNRVNFRWNCEKGHDTLTMDRKITLKGTTVSIACNKIDFRESSSADFIVETGKVIFETDTVIIISDNEKYTICNGEYNFIVNEKDKNKTTTKFSLKSTSDPDTDWRSQFALKSDLNSTLKGGKYVDTN